MRFLQALSRDTRAILVKGCWSMERIQYQLQLGHRCRNRHPVFFGRLAHPSIQTPERRFSLLWSLHFSLGNSGLVINFISYLPLTPKLDFVMYTRPALEVLFHWHLQARGTSPRIVQAPSSYRTISLLLYAINVAPDSHVEF